MQGGSTMAAPGPKQKLYQAMILLFENRSDEFKAAIFLVINKMEVDMAAELLLQSDSLKRATINLLIGDGGLPGMCRPEDAADDALGVPVFL
jgi:hypothetical protein